MSVLQSAGEYGLINGLKRQRTLTAKRDSELLVMQRHRYIAMTEADPRLALLLSRICMVRVTSCAVICACACDSLVMFSALQLLCQIDQWRELNCSSSSLLHLLPLIRLLLLRLLFPPPPPRPSSSFLLPSSI
jgi:hypothetical protein